jgi:uncharacterized protein YceH (UPF0502 family)
LEALTSIQARVLGCLVEKKETTPDQYPLTLNALRNACNQKSSRHPVTAYTEGEVGHAVRQLETMGYAREVWGARVARFEHTAGKALGVHGKGLALLCPMILRGPQTLGELRTHSHRLWEFGDVEDVQYALQRLQEHEPPLVTTVPRQPGQKEDRYAHLLCGEPELPPADPVQQAQVTPSPDLEARVEALEAALAECLERLERVERKDSL